MAGDPRRRRLLAHRLRRGRLQLRRCPLLRFGRFARHQQRAWAERTAPRNVRGAGARARVLMWGLFVGAAARSARARRPRGPGPAEDGHRVGGLGGQRRLRRRRRRLRQRVVDVHRVEVRARGVERPGLRCAGGGRRVRPTSRTAARGSCAPSTTIRPTACRTAARVSATANYDYWSYWHGSSGIVGLRRATARRNSRSRARLTTWRDWRFQTNEPASPSDPRPRRPLRTRRSAMRRPRCRRPRPRSGPRPTTTTMRAPPPATSDDADNRQRRRRVGAGHDDQLAAEHDGRSRDGATTTTAATPQAGVPRRRQLRIRRHRAGPAGGSQRVVRCPPNRSAPARPPHRGAGGARRATSSRSS